MTDPANDRDRRLLTVRLKDGTEAVFRKAADSSKVTLGEALASLGGRFQALADQLERGEASTVEEAEHNLQPDAQIGELVQHQPPTPGATVHELERRIEELERRLSDLERHISDTEGPNPRQ